MNRVAQVDLSDADKVYDTTDVIRKMKVSVRCKNELPDIPTCLKIMQMYFSLVFKSVLAGYTFDIPRFGKVFIIKRENEGKDGEKMKKFMKRLGRKYIMSYARLGYFYSIFVDSIYPARGYYAFKAAKEHREKLVDILNNTEFDYSTSHGN